MESGDFDYTQCEDASDGKVCRCVYSNGLTKASTEMRYEIPHCNACKYYNLGVLSSCLVTTFKVKPIPVTIPENLQSFNVKRLQ